MSMKILTKMIDDRYLLSESILNDLEYEQCLIRINAEIDSSEFNAIEDLYMTIRLSTEMGFYHKENEYVFNINLNAWGVENDTREVRICLEKAKSKLKLSDEENGGNLPLEEITKVMYEVEKYIKNIEGDK